MKEFWNDRYNEKGWAYGDIPNAFLKSKLPLFPIGKALFPAEGEGRNAVFAATLGWQVSAFDFSMVGKEKADKLAQSKGVEINYEVSKFLEETYSAEEFDMICMTSVHFRPDIKKEMHQRLDSYLKRGGHIIMEAFSKEHLELSKKNPKLGGPPSAEPMYSIEEIKCDFPNYDILELSKVMTHLEEGEYHVGESSVIRFIGKKR